VRIKVEKQYVEIERDANGSCSQIDSSGKIIYKLGKDGKKLQRFNKAIL
jgi:hypothetical protein